MLTALSITYAFAGAGPPRLVTVAIDRHNDDLDDEATADLAVRVSADDIVWNSLVFAQV
jgi:hypothetical protein